MSRVVTPLNPARANSVTAAAIIRSLVAMVSLIFGVSPLCCGAVLSGQWIPSGRPVAPALEGPSEQRGGPGTGRKFKTPERQFEGHLSTWPECLRARGGDWTPRRVLHLVQD